MLHHLLTRHSILHHYINELRNTNVQMDRARFRNNMARIGQIAALEISKELDYKTVEITTPLGIYQGKELEVQPVLCTILRAGVPLFDGLLQVFDHADCGFVAAYRKHSVNQDDFTIQQEYVTCPELSNRPLIIADPMLATGASLIEALNELQQNGQPSSIHIVCAIASQQGIEKVMQHYPQAHLWVGDIDSELTAKGYIVPGLGDAGDLSYGAKMQF